MAAALRRSAHTATQPPYTAATPAARARVALQRACADGILACSSRERMSDAHSKQHAHAIALSALFTLVHRCERHADARHLINA